MAKSVEFDHRENPESENQSDLTIGKIPKGKIKRIYPSGKPRKEKSNGFNHRENPERKNQTDLTIGKIPKGKIKRI